VLKDFPPTLFVLITLSGKGDIPSGLWHQIQFRGQPFIKKVTLMPGPSWIEYLFILKMSPFILKDKRQKLKAD
jgi:hypothetical protein